MRGTIQASLGITDTIRAPFIRHTHQDALPIRYPRYLRISPNSPVPTPLFRIGRTLYGYLTPDGEHDDSTVPSEGR